MDVPFSILFISLTNFIKNLYHFIYFHSSLLDSSLPSLLLKDFHPVLPQSIPPNQTNINLYSSRQLLEYTIRKVCLKKLHTVCQGRYNRQAKHILIVHFQNFDHISNGYTCWYARLKAEIYVTTLLEARYTGKNLLPFYWESVKLIRNML